MRRNIIIKENCIDSKKPTICIPVIETTKMEIITEAKRLINHGVSMIEWRADYFSNIEDENKLLEVLSELKFICKKCVLLITIRSKKQGGQGTLSEESLEHILNTIASSGCADMLDVEFFESSNPKRLIQKLKKTGCIIIASHHNFQKTPTNEEMFSMLEKMAEGCADIVKMAVMPQNISDVLNLLKVTNDFYVQYEETPVITMSMGKLGMISRISGEVFGSCITFGTMGEKSAPGQLPMGELQNALELIHKNYME